MNHKKLIIFVALAICFLRLPVEIQTAYAEFRSLGNDDTASIQGYIWLDEDENGELGEDETWIENIMVRLYDIDNSLKAITVTNSDGIFRFDELSIGEYQLEIIEPIGYSITSANQGRDGSVDLETGRIVVLATENSDEQPIGASLVEQPSLDPTPIALSEFKAGVYEGGEGIAILWETGAEIGTQGFRIWRSTTTDRSSAVEITGGLITSLSTSESAEDPPYQYLFIDTSVVDLSLFYTYWLQEVEDNNETHDYGPRHASELVAVEIDPSILVQDNYIYLPLIVR